MALISEAGFHGHPIDRRVQADAQGAPDLGLHGGGVYKRIDENREFLELLNEKAPALVANHPWLVGWFESQDEFLCELASAVPVVEAVFIPDDTNAPSTFPRPWL